MWRRNACRDWPQLQCQRLDDFQARRMIKGALHPNPILCWMCGSPADSSEHIFKARDLKRIFDEDGYDFDNLPYHFHVGGHRKIPGPKSKRMTFQKMICKACNGNRTSDFDRAYDRLSDWF